MNQRRLLIVDDEESFRKITARELERSSYSVEGAASLADARAELARGSFHVVLLDVRLPDGSGLDLLKEIRESYPGTDVSCSPPTAPFRRRSGR
jgi:two-component system response regulator PilR (NtrC family)